VDAADRDYGGAELRAGNFVVPPRLGPGDFDWTGSRPLQAWDCGPTRPESYFDDRPWKPRGITLIELYVPDILRIWPKEKDCTPLRTAIAGNGAFTLGLKQTTNAEGCGGASITVTGETQASGVVHSKRSPTPDIRKAIAVIYDLAEQQGVKPPNIKEIAPAVRKKLSASNLTASDLQIQKIAAEPEFKDRRGTPGKTIRGTLRAFSELEI